jgi:hypothetical protein
MASGWTSSRMGIDGSILELERNAARALPTGRNGVRVRVRRGVLMVTQAGDPEDHIVRAGEELALPPGGLVVAWSLASAVFAVREAAVRVDAAEALQCA